MSTVVERAAEYRPSRLIKESRRYRAELRALGLRVRMLREKKRWTQELAAEKMSVAVSHLAKIEGGSINLTFGTIVRIADGLGENLETLFRRPR